MPDFIIQREFAENFDPTDDTLRAIEDYNDDHDLKWITSFLSADKKTTYCLYEADDADALRKQAADLGFPADVITEVDELVR